MTCVNRSGEMISPVVMLIEPNNGIEGVAHGSAYDPYSEGGPFLWLNALANSPTQNGIQLVQYDPLAGEYTGVVHDYINELGGLNGYCGGLCLYEDYDANTAVLLGNNQQTPNHIFAYELTDLPPAGLPGAPFNVSATAADNGVLECTLEWTNPELNTLGEPLEELTEIRVYRNNILMIPLYSMTL